jgi:hypothetical protein
VLSISNDLYNIEPLIPPPRADLKYNVPLFVTQAEPSSTFEFIGLFNRTGLDQVVSEVRFIIQISLLNEGGRLEAKNCLFPSGDINDSQFIYIFFEKAAVSGIVQTPFRSCVWKITPFNQLAFTTEKYISLPSGENVGYVSNLLGREMIPGANFWGMLPGGVCPKYGCAKL